MFAAPSIQLPSADVWGLYPALAVLVLVMVVMGLGLRTIWREYKAWALQEGEKREQEHEKQRAWQRESDAVRDARWQKLITDLQCTNLAETDRTRSQLSQIFDALRQLTESSEQVNSSLRLLTEVLSKHIAVDDARFAVLFNLDQQERVKAVIKERAAHGNDTKTQPPS